MDNEEIFRILSEKIPSNKIMMVPVLLLMIDVEKWKFPEGLKTPEFQEIADIIENCEELKNAFQTARKRGTVL